MIVSFRRMALFIRLIAMEHATQMIPANAIRGL
jgi:hypothetical protein